MGGGTARCTCMGEEASGVWVADGVGTSLCVDVRNSNQEVLFGCLRSRVHFCSPISLWPAS